MHFFLKLILSDLIFFQVACELLMSTYTLIMREAKFIDGFQA